MMIKPMLLLFMAALFSSCGPAKYGITESWVFTEEKFSGNIQVDNDSGTPVTKGVMIETSIFLETKTTDLPVWTSAEINGKTYKITENTQVKSPFTVGKNKEDESPVILSVASGKFLYRLSLEAFDPPENNGEVENLRLSGTKNTDTISIRLTKKATKLLPQMVP